MKKVYVLIEETCSFNDSYEVVKVYARREDVEKEAAELTRKEKLEVEHAAECRRNDPTSSNSDGPQSSSTYMVWEVDLID
jgi:hypothetical protein